MIKRLHPAALQRHLVLPIELERLYQYFQLASVKRLMQVLCQSLQSEQQQMPLQQMCLGLKVRWSLLNQSPYQVIHQLVELYCQREQRLSSSNDFSQDLAYIFI
jgi:hypothetical protein